jgi:hypothetical protein
MFASPSFLVTSSGRSLALSRDLRFLAGRARGGAAAAGFRPVCAAVRHGSREAAWAPPRRGAACAPVAREQQRAGGPAAHFLRLRLPRLPVASCSATGSFLRASAGGHAAGAAAWALGAWRSRSARLLRLPAEAGGGPGGHRQAGSCAAICSRPLPPPPRLTRCRPHRRRRGSPGPARRGMHGMHGRHRPRSGARWGRGAARGRGGGAGGGGHATDPTAAAHLGLAVARAAGAQHLVGLLRLLRARHRLLHALQQGARVQRVVEDVAALLVRARGRAGEVAVLAGAIAVGVRVLVAAAEVPVGLGLLGVVLGHVVRVVRHRFSRAGGGGGGGAAVVPHGSRAGTAQGPGVCAQGGRGRGRESGGGVAGAARSGDNLARGLRTTRACKL